MIALVAVSIGLDGFLVLVFWDLVIGVISLLSGFLLFALFILSIDLVVWLVISR